MLSEFIKVNIYTDGDGNEYLIPDMYHEAVLELLEDIENCEHYTPAWWDLLDEFEDKFGKYKKDIFSVNLYMKEEDLYF